MSESIKTIKAQLAEISDMNDPRLPLIRQDSRITVQKLLATFDRKQQKKIHQLAAYQMRLSFEHRLWPTYPNIAGIDEVGRGPLAGPVICAAVILPHDFDGIEVNDSKQLSAKKRLALFDTIMSEAVSVSIGVGDNQMIDRENIYHTTELVMKQAVESLNVKPDFLLVDAMRVPVEIPQEKIIHGDARSISIGAASIVAKIVRDDLMEMYNRVYPGYDFANNMGYGTKNHLAGLAKLGPTPIHRYSFSPVAQYLI